MPDIPQEAYLTERQVQQAIAHDREPTVVATEQAWTAFKQWMLTAEGLQVSSLLAFEAGQADARQSPEVQGLVRAAKLVLEALRGDEEVYPGSIRWLTEALAAFHAAEVSP